MSRLDRHVALVQNKLTLARFFDALAWVALGYAVLVWAAVIVDRLFHVRLPRHGVACSDDGTCQRLWNRVELTVGEAGDFKCLKGSTSSPVLEEGGVFLLAPSRSLSPSSTQPQS